MKKNTFTKAIISIFILFNFFMIGSMQTSPKIRENIMLSSGDTEVENLMSVNSSLTVNESTTVGVKIIGYIKSITEINGETYIEVDSVEFYTGDEALQKAIEDGNAICEDGIYMIYDDYYIRNKNATTEIYKVSDSAEFYLNIYEVESNYTENASTNVSVNETYFKDVMNGYIKNNIERGTLCWFIIENGEIDTVIKQYTP